MPKKGKRAPERPWQVVSTEGERKVLATRSTAAAAREYLNDLPYEQRGWCTVQNRRTGQIDY